MKTFMLAMVLFTLLFGCLINPVAWVFSIIFALLALVFK